MAGRGTDIKLGGKFETNKHKDLIKQEAKKMRTLLNQKVVYVLLVRRDMKVEE